MALDWPEIEAFLVGDLGLSEREAALCSMREYSLRLEGFTRAQRRDYEGRRWLAWRLLAPYYKKGQTPQTPQAFWRFEWEAPEVEDVPEAEDCKLEQWQVDELNRIVALHLERINRKDG